MGYRYESPLAGTFVGIALHGRQAGKNFAGQHYTLLRHYDPTLMRFTSPDPAAAQFWNVNHYAGNNPGRYRDPDGLDYENIWSHLKEGDIAGAGKAYWQDVKGVTAESVRDAAAGMVYGAANLVTMGAYGMMVLGADGNSRANVQAHGGNAEG